MKVIVLSGQAGSGKDTFADYLCEHHRFVKVALADPIKRACMEIFGFSVEQLWGPSEKRNEPDPRFMGPEREMYISSSRRRLWVYGPKFVEELYPHFLAKQQMKALGGLWNWFEDVVDQKVINARYPLQTMGTEWGRENDPETWLRYAYSVVVPGIRSGEGYSASLGLQPFHGRRGFGVVLPDHRFKNEIQFAKKHDAVTVRLKRTGLDGNIEGGAKNHASEMEQKEISDSEFSTVLEVPEGKEAYYERIESLLRDIL